MRGIIKKAYRKFLLDKHDDLTLCVNCDGEGKLPHKRGTHKRCPTCRGSGLFKEGKPVVIV